jgi:hypothetical protein
MPAGSVSSNLASHPTVPGDVVDARNDFTVSERPSPSIAITTPDPALQQWNDAMQHVLDDVASTPTSPSSASTLFETADSSCPQDRHRASVRLKLVIFVTSLNNLMVTLTYMENPSSLSLEDRQQILSNPNLVMDLYTHATVTGASFMQVVSSIAVDLLESLPIHVESQHRKVFQQHKETLKRSLDELSLHLARGSARQGCFGTLEKVGQLMESFEDLIAYVERRHCSGEMDTSAEPLLENLAIDDNKSIRSTMTGFSRVVMPFEMVMLCLILQYKILIRSLFFLRLQIVNSDILPTMLLSLMSQLEESSVLYDRIADLPADIGELFVEPSDGITIKHATLGQAVSRLTHYKARGMSSSLDHC